MEYSVCLCIFFGETKLIYMSGEKEYLSAKLNGMALITVLGTIIYLIRAPWKSGMCQRCVIYLFDSYVMNSFPPTYKNIFFREPCVHRKEENLRETFPSTLKQKILKVLKKILSVLNYFAAIFSVELPIAKLCKWHAVSVRNRKKVTEALLVLQILSDNTAIL